MNLQLEIEDQGGRSFARMLGAVRAYDRYFLTRYPRVWLVRMHVVLVFAPLALVIALMVAAVIPARHELPQYVFHYINLLAIGIELFSFLLLLRILNDTRGYYFTRSIYNINILYILYIYMSISLCFIFGVSHIIDYRDPPLLPRITAAGGVPGTQYLTAQANSGKSRSEQALRLMAIGQARLKPLALSALATRERSTGDRRRVGRNKLFCL